MRCEFVCGRRALLDYSLKNSILRQIAVQLTVSEKDVPASLEKLSSELKDQKRKNKKMWDKLLQFEAQKLVQAAEGLFIKEVFTEGTNDEVKRLAINIINGGEFIVLFGLKLENRGHLILACSESRPSQRISAMMMSHVPEAAASDSCVSSRTSPWRCAR